MENYTIAESYTLPSKGNMYETKIKPNIKIRSMTTEEEMKRLGHSDLPYKLLAEIIDDCLVENPSVSAYDLCVGDYQFLLHKLRIVTYGPNYNIQTQCPICNNINKKVINLEELEVSEYSEGLEKYLNIVLPKTQKKLKLRMQTPRMLDEIKSRSKDALKKSPNLKGEPAFLFTLESLIEKIDGEVPNPVKLESFIRSLPMIDANFIIKNIEKINIGINPIIECKCSNCKTIYPNSFPITGEFFGPSID